MRPAYEPTWESLDAHPTPTWYQDGKFGALLAWGIYSVPAWAPVRLGLYAETYYDRMREPDNPWSALWQKRHRELYGEAFTYEDFIPLFRAERYDPESLMRSFKSWGMAYVVLVAKYHDGFCLWPGSGTDRHAGNMGPKRDLVGPLADAARGAGVRFGLYYSFLDWWHPEYPGAGYIEYAQNQVKELVERYHPDMLWFDGEWEHPSDFWGARDLVAWYYNQAEDPDEVCVNDRLGSETRGVHGDFTTPEYDAVAGISARAWEAVRGIGYTFGHNRDEGPADIMSAQEIIWLLADTASRNGRVNLGLGLMAEGVPVDFHAQRLGEVGAWLKINGAAIHGSRPWRHAEERNVRFTWKGSIVYAICLGWPGEILALRSVRSTPGTRITMLGIGGELSWRQDGDLLKIVTPLRRERPGDHAWVFACENVEERP